MYFRTGTVEIHKDVLWSIKCMGQDNTLVSTSLKTGFIQLQQDPFEQFVIRLRQLRAQQLRQLLANPTAITLDICNYLVQTHETFSTRAKCGS